MDFIKKWKMKKVKKVPYLFGKILKIKLKKIQ